MTKLISLIMFKKQFFYLLFTLLFIHVYSEEDLLNLELKGPFNSFDTSGKRTLKNYNIYGDTLIQENFARLTSDRQSKDGWLFSKDKFGTSRFSLVFRFRISGQGKNLYGDGITFFISDQIAPFKGKFDTKDSTSNEFNGFAISIDTFKNPESAHLHKDVSIIKGIKDATDYSVKNTQSNGREGCNVDLRYYEGRDDFSASKSFSYLRIQFKQEMYQGGYLQIDYDQRGDGHWQHCTTMKGKVVDKAAIDIANARLGVYAHTGQLADNHDLISIVGHSLNTFEKAPSFIPGTDGKKTTGDDKIIGAELDNMSSEEIIDLIFKKVEIKLENRLRLIKTDIEHKMVGLAEGLTNAVKKISKAEQGDREHIAELEKKIFGKVQHQLGQTMDQATKSDMDQLKSMIETTREEMESGKQRIKNLNEATNSLQLNMRNVGSGFGYSFWIFVILFIIVVGYFTHRVRQIEKKHFL